MYIKSQYKKLKRFYHSNYIYFVTTNTYKNIPYFKEEILCQLFIEYLRYIKSIKKFKLFAFVIIPWHVHLLIQPGIMFNISQIMFSIKKQFCHNANRIMGFNQIMYKSPVAGQALGQLQVIGQLQDGILKLHQQYVKKCDGNKKIQIPFKWQGSFYDRVIRNEKEYGQKLEYIARNTVKHGLVDDEIKYCWSFLNPDFQDLIDG